MIGIIFSRDRAFQLDGVIRSFFWHCREDAGFKLYVLYQATDQIYDRQYSALIHEYSGKYPIKFIKQIKFRPDVISILAQQADKAIPNSLLRGLASLGYRSAPLIRKIFRPQKQDYVLFLVDDNLFVSDFSLYQVCHALEKQPNAIGFSLRLGKNTIYSYAQDRNQNLPIFLQQDPDCLLYDWSKADGDFGYPLEVSSSVFRLSQIFNLLCEIPFKNPNTLEARMSERSEQYASTHPWLFCYPSSVTFCVPINIVQDVCKNRSGFLEEYSQMNLAQFFDKGKRIDIQSYDGFIPNACHQEVRLVYDAKERN